MRTVCYLFFILTFTSCNSGKSKNTANKMNNQTELSNQKIKDFQFLDCMYRDSYFPKFLVDKCKGILLELCLTIENKKPKNLPELYKLTHSATNKINDMEDEFFENNSEIETGARECLGTNFEFISKAYGFDAHIEELIATRNW